ncbi:MAG: ABC transporter substrate-binding protein [Chloroflexota bacterium]|nr:ABC transporter substrate-binding protein [Chloroflexota bacterium]
MGTGPYTLSRTSKDAMWWDLRDTWWAVDAGVVKEMPNVQRIVIQPIPEGADAGTLLVNNALDYPGSMVPGVFIAARDQNKKITTWNPGGPTYGAPDGCTYRLAFNGQRPIWNDPEIHWAINHAINRKEINLLAYEGTQRVEVLPISSYGAVFRYKTPLKPLIDKWKPDDFNISKTAEIMTKKGFKKGAGGFWVQPDGKPLPLTVFMGTGNPIGPVVSEQLRKAGFDAKFEVLAGASYSDTINTGTFDTILFTHCGSIYDPWQTLEHFHSKYVPPPDGKLTFIRAMTRYVNKDLDALLDKMEAMQPSPDDPTYMSLVSQAMEIYLRDMPEINLLEEFHVLPFNTTYWTGWPSIDDPYIAPYLPWEGFNLVIQRLKPTQ